MKYYDTSALLRAWKDGWAPESGMTRAHAVAELISIQSGRGLVYRAPDGQMTKRKRERLRSVQCSVSSFQFSAGSALCASRERSFKTVSL